MHGGGGACMAEGVHVGGCVWQGACLGGMFGGLVCVAGGMFGGHVWGLGMCGRGHVWQSACMAGGACMSRMPPPTHTL